MTDASDARGAVAFTAFPDSGYYVLAHEHGRLIADFGGPGESPNPGHQHAGILSYELSLHGRRVVVDSGAGCYDDSCARQRFRGTAAHNTVRIDGKNQYEVWKTFRVGRRLKVSAVGYESGDDFAWISASHDGYRRLGVEHRRAIALLGGSGWVVIDCFLGSGQHRVESFLHLHPGTEIDLAGAEIRIQRTAYSVIELSDGCREIRADWYSPRLGQMLPTRTLVRSEEVTLEAGKRGLIWAYGLLKSPVSAKCATRAHEALIDVTSAGAFWTIGAETNGLLRITRNRG